MTWQAFGKDDIAQTFKQGDSLKINEYKLVESQTGPPDYLTESELITLMEKHGIGTGNVFGFNFLLNYLLIPDFFLPLNDSRCIDSGAHQ